MVVDASVALCWMVPGQANADSASVLEQVRRNGAVVPPLWHIGVANQLGLKLRGQKITPERLALALELIQDLEIETNSHPAPVILLLDLMSQYRLTAYDAVYLELAMRLKRPLATFDHDLLAAAPQAGVSLVI